VARAEPGPAPVSLTVTAPSASPASSAASGQPVIEVSGLVKRYRSATGNALDGVSFAVAEGTLFCLLGPNGAGKTTAASILTTTLAPTAGTARIAGFDVVADQARVRREVGIVFQQPSLDPNLTAEENIRLYAVLYGCYPWRPSWRLMPGAYRRHVTVLAEILDLTASLRRPARTLSGGTRRKLEIARALLPSPRVLFLDEPTVGLDPQARRGLWAYLGRARAEAGATVFLTTHYLEEAEGADAICVLARGRIIERGSPAEIKARHPRSVPAVPSAVDPAATVSTAAGSTATVSTATGSTATVSTATVSASTVSSAGSLEDAYLALLDGSELGRADHDRPGAGLAGRS
jgi:ABC-2 type transport system ATP-binding protein